jgi:hypothetical protein
MCVSVEASGCQLSAISGNAARCLFDDFSARRSRALRELKADGRELLALTVQARAYRAS